MTLPLLVVGEALVDVVEDADGAVVEHVGGSPANVAFGLGALGHEVELLTWIGRDERGRRIAERCAQVGVHLATGSDAALATPVAYASLGDGREAVYRFELTWSLPSITDLPRFGHLHTGSLGAVLEPGGSQVLDAVRLARAHATISYDPNVRPSLMGAPNQVRPRVEALVSLADVVKASEEDITWLYAGARVPEVLRVWGQLGAALTVVTRGAGGAVFGLNRVGELASCPAPAVEVVDTVGAGDSFMAGLLSGLLDAQLLGEGSGRDRLRTAGLGQVRPAVERASATAAVTVSTAGAYAPTRSELGTEEGR